LPILRIALAAALASLFFGFVIPTAMQIAVALIGIVILPSLFFTSQAK